MSTQRRIEPVSFGQVTKLRIPYEIFGTGDIRIVFLAGMSLSRRSWVHQIIYFSTFPEFQLLVLENRGNGEVFNEASSGNYSTSAMARDVVRALDELKWSGKRSFHLVGFSMGGMIAMKVSGLIPDRIASLCLISTCAHYFPPLPSLNTLKHLLSTDVIELSFPASHLDEHDSRFAYSTNRDRYKASIENLISTDQSRSGKWGQIMSICTHHTSTSSLSAIGKQIGFAYIIHGSLDALISPKCAETLSSGIGCRKLVLSGIGHLSIWQASGTINRDLEKLIRQAHAFHRGNAN